MSFSRKRELPALPPPNVAVAQTSSQGLAQLSNSNRDLPPQLRSFDKSLAQYVETCHPLHLYFFEVYFRPPGSLVSMRQQLPPRQPTFPWSTHRLILRPRIVLNKAGINTHISTLSPPPFPRYGHSIPANSGCNGELYIFGGLVREFARNDVYLFSTQDNSVTLLQTTGLFPSPRVGHTSAFFADVLIVWGGDTNTDPASDKHDNGLYLLNLCAYNTP